MTRSKKLKLGCLAAAILAGVVVYFDGTSPVADQRAQYTITFAEAPGLNVGTPVRKSGVRIGEVTGLDLDANTGQVRVTIAVERKYLPRENEEPTIARGAHRHETTLDFVPKSNAEAVVDGTAPMHVNHLVMQAPAVPATTQESMERIQNSLLRMEKAVPKLEKAFDEITELAKTSREFIRLGQIDAKLTLAEVRNFAKEARPLVEDVRRILKANEDEIARTIKTVREASEGINDLLNKDNRAAFAGTVKNLESASAKVDDLFNDDNRKGVAALIKNLQASSDELGKTIKVTYFVMDQAEKTLKNINDRVTTVERVMGSAEKTLLSADATFRNLQTATKPIAENAEPVMKNLNQAAESLARTMQDARTTLGAFNRADGSFNKLLGDPTLFNSLSGSAASLNRTLMQAEQIARDLQVFADKVARRPELIGIGGALRTSNGLKDSPGTSPGPYLPPSVLEVPSYKPIAPTRSDLPP